MIPASYLFKDLYRDRFERDVPVEAPQDLPPRDAGLGRITVAALGLASGAPHFLFGALLATHPRRR